MSSPRENVLCQYHYDPLDRLISHALPDTPERQRFYCKNRLATEVQGAMHCSIVQHGDQLLAQQHSEGDAPDTVLLATDQPRSVLQSLKANRPPQPIAYSPYGHCSIESGFMSLLHFNGERPDSVTGHYLLGNGYRAFNPVLMRFNSPDSMSPFGKGGLNAYAYCLGDPVNLYDPDGTAGILNFASSVYRSAIKKINKVFPRYRNGKGLTREATNLKKIDYETLTTKTSNTGSHRTTSTSFYHRRRTYNNGRMSEFPKRIASMEIVEPKPILAELAFTKIDKFDSFLSKLHKENFVQRSRFRSATTDVDIENFRNAFHRERYSLEMNTNFYERGQVNLTPMYNRLLRQAQSGSLSRNSSIHTLTPMRSPWHL